MATPIPMFHSHTVPLGGEGLEPWPVTTEELEGSEMFGRLLWRSDDGTRAPGVWHATPGVIRDEVSYVVEGRRTVVSGPSDSADRRAHEVRTGDVMVMSTGMVVEWRIHEPMTKLECLRRRRASLLIRRPRREGHFDRGAAGALRWALT